MYKSAEQEWCSKVESQFSWILSFNAGKSETYKNQSLDNY